MAKITFKLEGGETVEFFAVPEENLLEAARKANVAIDAPCSGNVSCGKCRVKLLEGELDAPKTRHISDKEYAEGWRLACAAKVIGDVVIGVPDIASAYKSRMKIADLGSKEEIAIFEEVTRSLVEAGVPMENVFQEIDVVLEPPTPEDVLPDNERLKKKVSEITGIDNVLITFSVFQKMSWVLRQHDFHVKCAIQENAKGVKVMDITGPEDDKPMCGLAIDIGTTSVTAVLANLVDGSIVAKASAGNGQIRYGADVINRIIEASKEGGAKKLRDAIIVETLDPMVRSMLQSAGIEATRVMNVCIAGNTTMNHLMMGIYADPIRMEPFIPSFYNVECVYAGELGLPICPDAKVIISPNVGSYVGGDITAGTLTSLIWKEDDFSVFIDLGTNGEIVFGNSEFLMSCACSAGPAFEGGDISCGMRATDGAIEACTIDKETMEPTYQVVGGGKPIGICGSGLIDIIAELFRCGVVDSRGKIVRTGKRVLRDEHGMGSFIVAFESESDNDRAVLLNEVDIENFIRAKAAIFSAINVLLESTGFDISVVERVIIAGGIGHGINIENAVRIGMLPDIAREKYSYIGNSSLSGAYAMVMSKKAKDKVYEIAKNTTYVELSNEPSYMDAFVAACFIPHTDTSLFPSAGQD